MRALLIASVVGMVGVGVVSAQSVPLPAAVCQELRTGRAALPTPMTAAQRGVLLNRAAWVGRAAGIGLSRKTAGNICPSPVGSIGCDVVRLQNGTYWDVITGNAAESINCGNSMGTITDPARAWVAPVEPAGGGGTPPPVDPPQSDLTARVAALEATSKAQASDIAALKSQVAALDARLTVMGNRVTALEAHAPAPPCTPHEVTTTRDGGGWYGPGHSHRVAIPCP